MSGDVERRRCGQWRKLWIGNVLMLADLVATLQRGVGINHRLAIPTDTGNARALNKHEEINYAKD